MSVWMTEMVMRWSLRFSCGRFLWKQRFQVKASISRDSYFTTHQPVCFVGSKQYQKCVPGSLVSAERFHSQGGNHREEPEESSHLSSQLAELSSPAEVHLDGMSSEQNSPFMIHLQQCRSPSDILDLTCKYAPQVRQISTCLTYMWSSLKTMSHEQRRYELRLMFEHPEFDTFLQRVMSSVRHMHNNDIVHSLLSMINMGVPHRSRVVQTFLRTCQENLNDFDDKSLSVLASCLIQMKDSPNVNALKEGMKLVVEDHLPRMKNILPLQILMRLLGKDASKHLKQKLEKKALSMTEQFSVPNARHMISTMAAIDFYSKPLLRVCSQKITENLHITPFNSLYNVLQSCKALHYRDLDLFTGISDYVSSTIDMWTNKQLILFLAAFEAVHFCPDALMEAYATKVIENPNSLTLKDLLCVLKVYSSFNYNLKHQRQQFLDVISQALDSYLSRMNGSALLKAAYCFCLLNHFPPALLEQLLQTSVLEQIEEQNIHKGWERMFQTLDICLRLDRPPLPRPLSVPTFVLGNPAPSRQPVNPQLSQSLQSLLVGQTNTELQEMVVVQNFYVLVGVLTKPPSNHACVPETSSCTEEQRSPAESAQRIAVIYAPNSNFCYGTSNPRGLLALKLRHLKILGFTSVLVTEQDLQRKSEEDRTNLLRRLIFPEHTSETQPKMEHLDAVK